MYSEIYKISKENTARKKYIYEYAGINSCRKFCIMLKTNLMFKRLNLRVYNNLVRNSCRNIAKYKQFSSNSYDERLSILFFGTDGYSLAHLSKLWDIMNEKDSVIRNIGVVTPEPKERTNRKIKSSQSAFTCL